MRYIEAPNEWVRDKPQDESVFLAGSITGARDWQFHMAAMLSAASDQLVVLNPRRKHFDVNERGVGQAQIKWEHEHLRKAGAILFWFEENTLSPITLFELGVWSERSQQLVGDAPSTL